MLLHLSILYEYQQFFQHRICFSIQPPDNSDPWPRLADLSSFFCNRLSKAMIIFNWIWSNTKTISLIEVIEQSLIRRPNIRIRIRIRILLSNRGPTTRGKYMMIKPKYKCNHLNAVNWIKSKLSIAYIIHKVQLK